METTSLVLSMLFGVFGFSYFVYGKRQMKISALVAGVALCVYPYFVSNVLLMAVIGIGLMAAPFFMEV